MSGKRFRWSPVDTKRLLSLAKTHPVNWKEVANSWNPARTAGTPYKTPLQLKDYYYAVKNKINMEVKGATPPQTFKGCQVFNNYHHMSVSGLSGPQEPQALSNSPQLSSLPQFIPGPSPNTHHTHNTETFPPYITSPPSTNHPDIMPARRLQDDFEAEESEDDQRAQKLAMEERRKKEREARELQQTEPQKKKEDEEMLADRRWVREKVYPITNHTDLRAMKGLQSVRMRLVESVVRPLLMRGSIDSRTLMFYGPPGTGKTSLAMSLASTIHATLWLITPASLASSYKGKPLRLAEMLFREAAESARWDRPSIILFDECHSILCSNPNSNDSDGAVFLTEIQEMLNKAPYVILIGTTNFPWQMDSRFLRRFDAWIHIPLPNQQEVEEQIRAHITNSKRAKWHDVNVADVAKLMVGQRYSYSDIDKLMRNVVLQEIEKVRKDNGVTDVESLLAQMELQIEQGIPDELVNINTAAMIEAVTSGAPQFSQEEVDKLKRWQAPT